MTLTDFLLARIAEDERRRTAYWHDLECAAAYDASAECDCGSQTRVLAECAAKRRLVKYAAFMLKAWANKPGGAYPDMTRRERHTANVILDQLAAVYADHPDYDEAWKP